MHFFYHLGRLLPIKVMGEKHRSCCFTFPPSLAFQFLVALLLGINLSYHLCFQPSTVQKTIGNSCNLAHDLGVLIDQQNKVKKKSAQRDW